MDNNDFVISKVKLIEQAKEMEKEQIKNAYWDGNQDVGYKLLAEQYYNETFKIE
jgi:hypothetical protein